MKSNLRKRAVAEFLGTAFLVSAVVGSGIMADRLAGGNTAVALLANTIATGAALVALILAFGPISGAHFNPVVSLAYAIEGGLAWRETPIYIFAQVLGGVAGTVLAHAMFALPLVSFSRHARSGPAQILSEFVATFGLLCVIWGCSRSRPNAVPFAVGSYITAAYWFTRVHILCESGGNHCEVAERYVCWDSSGGHFAVCACAVCGRARGDVSFSLVRQKHCERAGRAAGRRR